MRQLQIVLLSVILASAGMTAHAQTQAQSQAPLQTGGTLVVVPGFGEVRHPNDEVRVTFMVEEQDKDKAAAASRVNQKMKQGMEIIRRQDPRATLKTVSYYTYPPGGPDYPQPPRPVDSRAKQPNNWRVGQYLEVTTTNLNELPQTVAAAQRVLALSNVFFGLTEATSKKLDAQRIDAAYKNLTDRIVAIARTMGRNPADAVLDTVDFEASGAYAPEIQSAKLARGGAPMDGAPVAEPSFEPGETILQTRVVAKVRFK